MTSLSDSARWFQFHQWTGYGLIFLGSIYIYREHIEVHSGFITQESNGNRISTQLREGSLKKLTTNNIFVMNLFLAVMDESPFFQL